MEYVTIAMMELSYLMDIVFFVLMVKFMISHQIAVNVDQGQSLQSMDV